MFSKECNPLLLKDMEKCVDRINKALKEKEKILVFGDSDTDGVTGTSILYDFLIKLGGVVDYYIVNRDTEGYGLSENVLDKIFEINPNLIITVDCGTTNIKSIERINEQGIETIITDHHESYYEVPDAYGIINPKIEEYDHPLGELAGVGVVFTLIVALCQKNGLEKELYLNYLDRVALGTIADKVDLTDINVELITQGIKQITAAPSLGVKKLLENSSLNGKNLSLFSNFEQFANFISFELVPVVNSKGKLGQDAKICVELFNTNNESRAKEIIFELNKSNAERRRIEQSIRSEVEQKIKDQQLSNDRIIVVSGKDWKGGVIGSVASSVVQTYSKCSKAAILFRVKDGIAKGSGRSAEGFNLFRTLGSCKKKNLIQYFGGHEEACGLAADEENIDEIKSYINNIVKITEETARNLDSLMAKKKVTEIEITLDKANMLKDLKTRQVFSCHGMRVVDFSQKSTDVLTLTLAGRDNSNIKAVAFNMDNIVDTIKKDDYLDVKFTIGEFMNAVQLKLQDIQITNKVPVCNITPQKVQTIELYANGITLENAKNVKYSNLFGNTSPLFLCRAMQVVYPPQIIGNNHLKLVLVGENTPCIDAVAFDMGNMINTIKKGDLVDVKFEFNEFREKVQMKIKNIHVLKEELEDVESMEITCDKINLNNAKGIKNLRLSGIIHPPFLCRGMRVVADPQIAKKGNHLRLVLAGNDNRPIDAIAFDMGDMINTIKKDDFVDVKFELDEFRGKIQMKIKKICFPKNKSMQSEEIQPVEIEADETFMEKIILLKELNSCGLFSCHCMRIVNWPQKSKNGNHLRLVLAGDNTPPIDAIAFDMGDMVSTIKKGSCVDVQFEVSEFMGKISLKIQNIKLLEKKLESIEINADGLTLDNARKLRDFNLFKNSDPIFLCRSMKVTNQPQRINNGNHLRLTLSNNNTEIDAIAFDMGDMAGYIKKYDRVDVSFNLHEYNDKVEMKIKDIRISKKNLSKNFKRKLDMIPQEELNKPNKKPRLEIIL